MKWSEEKEPNDGVPYNHVVCETPLGNIRIDWKSWKESPSYVITIENKCIGVCYALEESEKFSEKYLRDKLTELQEFLKPDSD